VLQLLALSAARQSPPKHEEEKTKAEGWTVTEVPRSLGKDGTMAMVWDNVIYIYIYMYNMYIIHTVYIIYFHDEELLTDYGFKLWLPINVG
jgi:hypothetical protein